MDMMADFFSAMSSEEKSLSPNSLSSSLFADYHLEKKDFLLM